MYQVYIHCEKYGAFMGRACEAASYSTPDLTAPVPADVTDAMAKRGWVERDGKHYCARHDPAKQGEMVRVSLEYLEIAPGVRIRYGLAGQEGDSVPIEVFRDEPFTPIDLDPTALARLATNEGFDGITG